MTGHADYILMLYKLNRLYECIIMLISTYYKYKHKSIKHNVDGSIIVTLWYIL